MGVWCEHPACKKSTRPRAEATFFPELQGAAEGIPPLVTPAFSAPRMPQQFRFDVGRSRTNPVVENIGTIQNIRSIKKLITGDTDTSRPAPIESWAVMQNEDDPFEEPLTADDMNSPIALDLMRRGTGIMLMHAGYEETELDAATQFSTIAIHYLEQLCRSIRHRRDACPPAESLEETAAAVVHKQAVGGRAGLTTYWHDDVIGFGRGTDENTGQLRMINNTLEERLRMVTAMQHGTIEIPDNDVGMVTGNFGETVGDLGLDILGLQEMGLAEMEGIPDKLVRDAKQNHILQSKYGGSGVAMSFARPYAKAGPNPRSAGAPAPKDETLPVRKFTVPPQWQSVKPTNTIKLLEPFLTKSTMR